MTTVNIDLLRALESERRRMAKQARRARGLAR